MLRNGIKHVSHYVPKLFSIPKNVNFEHDHLKEFSLTPITEDGYICKRKILAPVDFESKYLNVIL